MAKWEKLLERLYRLDMSIRFEELTKILKTFGYLPNETGGGSSHVTFRKKGCNPVTIPRHSPIKKVYIELVKNVVINETLDKNDNQEEKHESV